MENSISKNTLTTFFPTTSVGGLTPPGLFFPWEKNIEVMKRELEDQNKGKTTVNPDGSKTNPPISGNATLNFQDWTTTEKIVFFSSIGIGAIFLIKIIF